MTTDRTHWIKLRVGDDWGNEYLERADTTARYSANASRGLRLTEGEPVTVRMPDGSIRTERLVSREKLNRISDHGHEYEAKTRAWGVQFTAFGVTTFVPLADLEVQEGWVADREPPCSIECAILPVAKREPGHPTTIGPGCIEIEGTMTSHFPGVPIPGPLGLVDGIVAILRSLDSDEARAALLSEVLARVCRYCGSMLDYDRRCYCEDDE